MIDRFHWHTQLTGCIFLRRASLSGQIASRQPRFFPPGLPPGRLPPGRPVGGFRLPPVLPLKPGPDLGKPPDLGLEAGFERPAEGGLPAPVDLDFQAGFPVDDPERLLLGRAPPGRGLPVLVVKGRERSPSGRGGWPAPNSRGPERPEPPLGRAPLGRTTDGPPGNGRSKRGRSGLGRSDIERSDRG